MLNPTRCIRLATSLSFDTFQQRPTILDDVGSIWPVWVNEKILEILTLRDTNQFEI